MSSPQNSTASSTIISKDKNKDKDKDKDREKEERITFSITTMPSELPGKLYLAAKSLGVGVASVFRQNLSMYQFLLSEESESLTARERKVVAELSEVLSLSHLCRVEAKPDRVLVIDHLARAGRTDLCGHINSASTIRLLLILDNARALAAKPSLNGEQSR